MVMVMCMVMVMFMVMFMVMVMVIFMVRGEGDGGEVATWATSTCTMTNGKQV